jgi:PAS domain S-box-containing protein
MNNEFFQSIINNVAILLVLALLNQLRHQYFKKMGKNAFIEGVIAGLIGVAIMMNPLVFRAGLVFDTRSILLSLLTLFFPMPTALIAAGITTIYRIIMGGVGMLTGILVIVVVTGFGYLWRRFVFEKTFMNRATELYVFGVLVHFLMLLCMFTLPKNLAAETLSTLGPSILFIYPIGTLILGLLFYQIRDIDETTTKVFENEAVYRGIFENNHAIMLLINPKTGEIEDANSAALSFYGYPKETLLSMKINQINTLSAEEIKEEMQRSIRSEKNYFEFKHRRANGMISDVEVHSGNVQIKGETLLYSIIHDVSQKVSFQNAIQERDRLLRAMLNHSPYAVFLVVDFEFKYLNQPAFELFGVVNSNHILTHSVFEYIAPMYHDQVRERLTRLIKDKGALEPTELVYLRHDGTAFEVEVLSVYYEYDGVIGTLAFARDISEQKKIQTARFELEQRSQQQQKLESIGLLAGGVAHEINNPIQGIMNYAELIVEGSAEPKLQEYASEIISESKRVSEIVRNLLQFSRMDKQSHSSARIEDIINRTISLVNTIFRKDNIKITVEIEDDLPSIQCRSQQLQQVLMNLLTNARDAIQEDFNLDKIDKHIIIAAHRQIHHHRDYLVLSVADNGVGIQDDVKEKLFQPFFSTKSKDKGTGLGLSISYGIIKDHDGFIEVINEKGNTRFDVFLPVKGDY